MTVISEPEQVANLDPKPKWLNSPVTTHEGSLGEIRRYVPIFQRRTFGLTQPSNNSSRLNQHLDIIVRLPFQEDENFVPVGMVSKNYILVQHIDVVDVAAQALKGLNIDPVHARCEIKITEYGERMGLSLYLPEKFSFDPGDGNPMALRLECVNSVDRSTRFRALMGWFRFVCSNGLVVGITRSDFRRRHVGGTPLQDVRSVLLASLENFETEKANFARWRRLEVTPEKLASWVDSILRSESSYCGNQGLPANFT